MRSRTIQALEAAHNASYYIIRAAEGWAAIYDKSPVEHRQLIKTENQLNRNLRQYFKQFAAQRVASWVNWSVYQTKVVKAADLEITLDESDPTVTAEQTLMLGVMFDEIKAGMLSGAMGARMTYERWIGQAEVNDLIQQQAIDHAAELAKGLNSTTLSNVQRSIEKSISLGENVDQATERLQAYIASPMRAELIARTESVRAYSAGIVDYGRRTGAATKTWDALPGADEGSDATPCLDNASQDAIPIDDDFDSGDPFPPAHPRCRCGVTLQYDSSN